MPAFIDKWFSRGANAATFWTFVPAGLFSVVIGFASSGVTWINQFGAFGWLSSGLLAFVLASFGFAAIVRARLWLIDARYRSKLASGSSPFDPMATVYQNQRELYTKLDRFRLRRPSN